MVRLSFVFILVLFVVAACEAQDVQIPTVAVLPSITPSLTATYTPTMTDTPTLTFTPTATDTPITPTNTAVPPATATNTLIPSPTQTHTPLASLTPIPTRTPAAPQIDLFQANPPSGVYGGDSVLLRWATDADMVYIDRLDVTGIVQESIVVEPIGSVTVTLPTEGALAVYRLVASRAGSETSQSITFALSRPCTLSWFFTSSETSIGCPAENPSSVELVFQQFERGYMIHVIGPINRICGIQNDRNVYTCFAAEPFLGTPPAPVTPQAGQIEPGVNFQDVFYNKLALGGLWYNIIGWATAEQVTIYADMQVGENDRRYIRTPMGLLSFDRDLTGSARPIQGIPEQ